MYCGSNKTALTSQKQISSAMLSLLQTKSYADISVCEICKEAQISRQTFYSLFRSKENVISYELEQNYCFTLHSDCMEEDFTLDRLSDAYASYIEGQKDFIASGLSSIAKNYVLYESEIDSDYLRRMICRLFGGELFSSDL